MAQTLHNYRYTIFLIDHLYYIPQFSPIARELKKRGKSILFLLMGLDTADKVQLAYDYCLAEGFNPRYYQKEETSYHCDFLINGSHGFPKLDNIKWRYSASVVHGIGTKAGNFTEELNRHDIRFLEGEQRLKLIRKLFPASPCKLYNVGFAKLDEAFQISASDKLSMLKSFHLDPEKKTLLYAPTFFPSSIERMPCDFPADFKNYNLIIKPHFFSFDNKKYRHQVRKFKKWASYSNVFLAGPEYFNLVPFMTLADVMISDESSAIFEFAALDKPVILNQNVRYRWSYRLLKFKKKKRMDSQMEAYKQVADIVVNYPQLVKAVNYALHHPSHKQAERKQVTELVVGKVDGRVSQRIVDIMEQQS